MGREFDSLDPTEPAGIGAELNRCRVLAAKIENELRTKRPEHFIDTLALADIHASLEHAADVLGVVGTTGKRGRCSWQSMAFSASGDGGRRLPEQFARADLRERYRLMDCTHFGI
jgi:hypothetical protein